MSHHLPPAVHADNVKCRPCKHELVIICVHFDAVTGQLRLTKIKVINHIQSNRVNEMKADIIDPQRSRQLRLTKFKFVIHT